MNIGIDATVVRPPFSGVHHTVKSQTNALLAESSDHTFTVFSTDPDLQSSAGSANNASSVNISPSHRRVARRVLWQQWQLPWALTSAACDLLYAPSYTAPNDLRTPYILQVHDLIALDTPELCSHLNALHMHLLMPTSIRKARHIIVPSQHVADRIMTHFHRSADCIHVLHHAVDDVFRHATDFTSLAQDDAYILFVGNIEPKKGLDVLLTAYQQLSNDVDAPALYLAGRTAWKSRDIIERIHSYSGKGKIRLLGYVEREQLPGLYANAHCTVMASSTEGFGLPVIEGMAMNCPIVHSDHPVLMETAGGCGASFTSGNADELRDILVDLIASPDTRKNLAEKGLTYAHSRTWSHWAKDFLSIIA